jgi:predicted lipoprotein with Yx(FWY)xxD motif
VVVHNYYSSFAFGLRKLRLSDLTSYLWREAIFHTKPLNLSRCVRSLGGPMSVNLCALILAIVALMTINITTGAKDAYTVNMVDSKEFGNYLTNETFFTLYRYLSDPQDKEISTCYGSCARIWQPFYEEKLTIDPELKSIDFDVITRDDGEKQLTYKGWPLYLYNEDTKPLETNGQSIDGLWFVVNPQNLSR